MRGNENIMKLKKKKFNYNSVILRYSLLSLKNKKLFGTYLIETIGLSLIFHFVTVSGNFLQIHGLKSLLVP